MSDPTRCLRPAGAVFDYLTAVGVAIDWDYAGLWERLVEEAVRLHEIVPVEHEAPVAILRRLVGAADTVAFRLHGPLARRAELGQRPPATQVSLDTVTTCVRAD